MIERETLDIRPRSSRLLAVLLAVLHLGAFVALWAAPPGVLFKLTVSLAILASWAYCHYRHVRLRGRDPMRVICQPDDRWQIEVGGRLRQAELLPSSFVHPWLIVLVFRLPGHRLRYAVPLLPDSADPALLRRLRVRLNTQRRQANRSAF